MLYQQITTKYTQASYSTSGVRQIIMLYDGIIRNIKSTQICVSQNDYEGIYNSITKAKNIVQGLQLAIDHNAGGEVAKTLDAFYNNIFFRLSLFNNKFEKNPQQYLQKIIDEVAIMRDAWEDIEAKTTTTTYNTDTSSTNAGIRV